MAGHSQAMVAEIYIEALFVDEEAADQTWQAWDTGEIDEMCASISWITIADQKWKKVPDLFFAIYIRHL